MPPILMIQSEIKFNTIRPLSLPPAPWERVHMEGIFELPTIWATEDP